MARKKFKEGDEIVIIEGGEYAEKHPSKYPVWGKDGKFEVGVIDDIDDDGEMSVNFDGEAGKVAFYIDADDGRGLKIELFSKVRETKEVKLKMDELDKLVLSDDYKSEIISVLKQFENRKLIFENWGLKETIEYGLGMTFLFHGIPGTGKTWAATCISKSLGMQLHVVSASQIQTSEPGGANRNIENAFKKASNSVLFLDECDSLITARNHVGMILGSEINTLLTEIEKFEGILIMATNRIESLDEALERRISLILEFKMPTHDERKDIWEKLIPKKMPLARDVKVAELAQESLTGGQIKNALLQAARLAVASDQDKVTMKNFKQAIERIQKSKNLMGKTRLPQKSYVKTEVSKSR